MLNVRRYLVTIVMPDGSVGRHHGLFCDAFEAVVQTLTDFPEACRVFARRLA